MKRLVTITAYLDEQTFEEALALAQGEQDEDEIEWITQNKAVFPRVIGVDSVFINGTKVAKDDTNPIEDSYIIHKPVDGDSSMFVHLAAFWE